MIPTYSCETLCIAVDFVQIEASLFRREGFMNYKTSMLVLIKL